MAVIIVATTVIGTVVQSVVRCDLMWQGWKSVTHWSAPSVLNLPSMTNGGRMFQESAVMTLAVGDVVRPLQM